MPRPRKGRRVCEMPSFSRFGPLDGLPGGGGPVVMTVDEYETLRLIDLEDHTQEECAGQMGVARTTVQGIYESARRKVAHALVGGRPLLISGGEIRLCDGSGPLCAQRCRRMRRGGQGRDR